MAMQDDKPFFPRDPWRFDPHAARASRKDTPQGFNTRALHTGFDLMKDFEPFRSFVPPITPSIVSI
jgi:hypothetical protein